MKEEKKLVNLLVGRFQPFTIGDLGEAQGMNISNGLPVVVVYVRSHQGYKNTPLKSDTVRRMLTELKDLDLFEDVTYSDSWEPMEVLGKINKLGYKAANVKFSDHNNTQSQLARLSADVGDKTTFSKCVPSPMRKYFDEICKEIKEYE